MLTVSTTSDGEPGAALTARSDGDGLSIALTAPTGETGIRVLHVADDHRDRFAVLLHRAIDQAEGRERAEEYLTAYTAGNVPVEIEPLEATDVDGPMVRLTAGAYHDESVWLELTADDARRLADLLANT